MYLLTQALQQGVDGAALATDLSKLDNQVTTLKHKVAGELTGARYMCTFASRVHVQLNIYVCNMCIVL